MTSTDQMVAQYARAYQRKGWAVFPLAPGTNEPTSGSHGFKDATTGPRLWPPNCNMGISTGAVSDLVVVDVDGSQGRQSLYSLFAEHERFPDTPIALTPHGAHILFRHPGGRVACAVGFEPGLDVRGDGGYIAAPPSRRDCGVYQWHPHATPGQILLAPIPGWLLELLRPKRQAACAPVGNYEGRPLIERCRAYLTRIEPAIEGQGGDAATYRAATIGGDFSLSESEFWPLFCEWNLRCSPPWGEKDLRAKLDHAEKYRRELRGCRV